MCVVVLTLSGRAVPVEPGEGAHVLALFIIASIIQAGVRRRRGGGGGHGHGNITTRDYTAPFSFMMDGPTPSSSLLLIYLEVLARAPVRRAEVLAGGAVAVATAALVVARDARRARRLGVHLHTHTHTQTNRSCMTTLSIHSRLECMYEVVE